jgi:hypothetical protein
MYTIFYTENVKFRTIHGSFSCGISARQIYRLKIAFLLHWKTVSADLRQFYKQLNPFNPLGLFLELDIPRFTLFPGLSKHSFNRALQGTDSIYVSDILRPAHVNCYLSIVKQSLALTKAKS